MDLSMKWLNDFVDVSDTGGQGHYKRSSRKGFIGCSARRF